MNATIRGLKGLLALGALAGLGLLLRWVTAGSIGAATAQDLTAMASLAVGAVAWVAYCWLVVAVLATVLEQAPGAVGRGASVVAARITSQSSRALLRSALGVAAVTPLTIGVAQATPTDSTHTFTTSTATAPSGTRPWTSVEPRSTVQAQGTAPADSHPRTSAEPRPTIQVTSSSQPARSVDSALSRTATSPAGSRPWSSVEPRSAIELTGGTSTSAHRSSSMEARSVPQTDSTSVQPHSTSQLTDSSRPARSVQSRPALPLTAASPADSRPWSSAEPPSSVELAASPNSSSVDAHSDVPQTGRTSSGSRPWSSVEPRSTVELTGDSSGDWRATEAPSSVRLTEHGSGKTSARTEAGRAVAPRTTSTGKASHRTQPTTRTSAAAGNPTPTARTAVPESTGRTALPEPTRRTALPEKSPAGQVAVPDRPTTGAATRYTSLQSGQLARPASRVVKPGESLWSIAATELGPTATDDAIAARWPQWYAANRQLIGPDPNLIHPGQVLNPPAPSHPVPPTHQEK